MLLGRRIFISLSLTKQVKYKSILSRISNHYKFVRTQNRAPGSRPTSMKSLCRSKAIGNLLKLKTELGKCGGTCTDYYKFVTKTRLQFLKLTH